jgi:hypothetical protein
VITSTSCALGQPLLAVVAEDPPEVRFAVGGEDDLGRELAGGIHAHVERGVLGVGEAAVDAIELEG